MRAFRQVRRPFAGLLAAAVVCLVAAAARAQADPPRPTRWVSAKALVYLEAARPGLLLDRATDPRFQTLLGAVPGYKKAIESPGYRQFRTVVDVITNSLGTTWEPALRDLTGGGIVLAVEGEKGSNPRVIVMVTPQDSAFLARAHAKVLELARKDAADKGRPDPVTEVEYRGLTTYHVGDHGAHTILDGVLIVASQEDVLKTVIDRARNQAEGFTPITEDATWKARRSEADPQALAWGMARLDRLREIDPQRFTIPGKAETGRTILFGPWVESLGQAPWVAASLTWTADRLGADVTLATPPGGYSEPLKKFLPPAEGAPAPLQVPGTIASAGLWRDLAAIWEVRADLLPPEAVQNLTKLDSFAGQFFGGRDFGTGVLGALAGRWRLIAAQQDYQAMNPVPDVKYPGFALVIDLKPGDEEFAERLKVAFQSFIGLANLGAAESKSKAPPLMLGSETVDGVTISTAKFMPPASPPPKDEPVHYRHNFSPSVAQVGDHFIISSSIGLTRELIKAVKAARPATDATLVAEANGPELAKIVELNRARLVMQNMLQKGNDKAAAEKEIGLLAELLRYLGRGSLTVKDRADAVRLRANFALQPGNQAKESGRDF